MKLTAFFVSLLAPVAAWAGGLPQKEECGPQLPIEVAIKRKIVRKPRPVVITKTVQVPVASPQHQSQSNQGTNTNTQTIVVNIMQPTATAQKKYHLDVAATKTIYTRPNRLLLIGGLSRTNASVKTDDCGCSASLQVKREFDVGALYLRDVGRFTIGAGATIRQNFFLAAGFNW